MSSSPVTDAREADQQPRRRLRLPRRRYRLMIYAIVGVTCYLIWRQFFETYHLVTIDEGKLYRDGIHSVREFRRALKLTNPKTVISILDDGEYNQPEFVAARKLIKDRGIEYHRISIQAGGYPTAEQVRQFLVIASDPAKHPVLCHDDEGIRRSGMMTAAYQESVMGYDNEKTKAAIVDFDHSERTIGEIRAFIDAYDPVNGLTRDLNLEDPAPKTP